MKIAVVGASGVVGRALVNHLMKEGIDVVGLSRRAPDGLTAPFVALDLMNAEACVATVQTHLTDVTHVVYAALYEKPGLIAGWFDEDQMSTNEQMLNNLLQPLAEHATRLRHVTLLQGTKAYGAHVTPMKIPGKESAPRHQHANFYWLQEDLLLRFCSQFNWQFTIWRPQVIIGHAPHHH